ncbi:TPA: hypothetical protein DCZ46_02910 [Candidatus Campbellbacteria bacterium]|uniref:Two-component sensor histidine kinase n=2 Tax=Candidatus Campbelliibacteriota TaxID=1752727 RepID=A0A1F5EP98_9BACT|nr:MAG: protein of unknown function with transmembrane region [Candidatus Campbellbacteria bacterium GW2011_OD1_34_28]KKP74923.1 MAG: hypothetical protein UR74_C0002G0189 [Candidatus Campbellbacteria bacterium GW2011_GWD2_35_24]KKP75809.1 MAG: hypothetical protein UR75_C0002G0190 [Candidatus Campbellbacteria bacterium GW2011_GWC2_35_28]KKP76943.1 MAG: hypothetical protein UR76_C0002G0144 [Candidatus Campbellbacteria bacterium GW2011_GWC1_35_31]KKP78869.1 MAG: hypothetical protein UR79_C0002G014
MSGDFLTKIRNKPEEEKRSLLFTYTVFTMIGIILIAIILNYFFEDNKRKKEYGNNSIQEMKVFVLKIWDDFGGIYQQIDLK